MTPVTEEEMILIDQFAAAALTGYCSSAASLCGDSLLYRAESAYKQGLAMLEARRKISANIAVTKFDEHQFSNHIYDEVADKTTGQPEEVNYSSALDKVIAENSGKKLTCTQIFQLINGLEIKPHPVSLKNIGADLRCRGYKKARSGGLDYYQL